MEKKQKTGEFIYGIHPIIELLKAKKRKIITLYTTRPEPKVWHLITPLLAQKKVQIQYVDRAVLEKMVSTTDHQGIVALVSPFIFRSKPFDPQKQSSLLLLDGIQDSRNLGAILRSAYCTGVQGIVMTKKHSAPLNGAAIKASAGLAEHLEIMLAPSALSAAQELKAAGYSIYVATFDGQNALRVTYKTPFAIIIGGEGEGVTPGITKYGTSVTLPQCRPDISYNASVAAGILLFIATQQKS